jgi:uncharacterized membrane protein
MEKHKVQWQIILSRIRKPSVIMSVTSQLISLLMILGVHLNQNTIMTVVAIGCTILASLGILSNPDTQKGGYGDDILTSAGTGKKEPHVLINGQMVCKSSGAVYDPAKDLEKPAIE